MAWTPRPSSWRYGSHSPETDDAIGAAKQLVEATAKVVLQERGVPVDERHNLPERVKQAQQALMR
jgi:hypothetical protein